MLELPDKSPQVWQRFFTENKPLIYRYIIRQVEKGIDENLPKVVLFKFKSHPHEKVVERHNYLKVLQEALAVFIKVEDYESASRTKKLIDEYHINKLIRESNEV